MNNRKIWELIHQLRISIHANVDLLCQGLCTCQNLYRIEQGKRHANRWVMEGILSRLGKSTNRFDFFVTMREYELQELRNEILTAYQEKEWNLMQELFSEYQRCQEAEQNSHKQFILMVKALLLEKEEKAEEQIVQLERAIALTISDFKEKPFEQIYLSEVEIYLVQRLTATYEAVGKVTLSMKFSYHLLRYLNQDHIDDEIRDKIYPFLALSLARKLDYLGEQEQLEEICRKALAILKKRSGIHYYPELQRLWVSSRRKSGRLTKAEEMQCTELSRRADQMAEILCEYGTHSDTAYSEKFTMAWESSFYAKNSHRIGDAIQTRRIAIGLSQEDLSDGICSVRALSNIENGKSKPSVNHFEKLMKKLGATSGQFEMFADRSCFSMNDKRIKIEEFILRFQYEEVGKLVWEWRKEVIEDTVDQQFLLFAQAVLDQKVYRKEPEYCLAELEQALAYTLPDYKKKNLSTSHLNRMEIRILNSIAEIYGSTGDWKRAIEIYRHMKENQDRDKWNQRSHFGTYGLILSGLSKHLGLDGRYEEALEISKIGVDLSVKTDHGELLIDFLCLLAWNIEAKIGEDIMQIRKMQKACKKYLKQAFCLAQVIDSNRLEELIQNEYLAKYKRSILQDVENY